MLTEPGGPFIDVSKLNLSKYAHRPALAKALFEYLFYHEADIRAVIVWAVVYNHHCYVQCCVLLLVLLLFIVCCSVAIQCVLFC